MTGNMDRQPNIVFLFPDQLRADFVGCYGASFAKTPALDALAAEGTLYERALSMHPICVPARAALLTGCNALSTGVLDNNHWLRPDHGDCGMPSWPSLLAAAGYHTEGIGKMHFTPWDMSEGFDHRVVAEDKRHVHVQDDYGAYLARHGLKKLRGWEEEGYLENRMASYGGIPTEHQVDAWVGRQAVDFLESYAGEKPFACMVAFPGPHDPYNPPREYAERFDPADMPEPAPGTPDTERFRAAHIRDYAGGSSRIDLETFPDGVKRRIRVHYSALIALIDEQVRDIVAAADARRDGRDTIIIFAADHGDFVGDYDFLGKNLFFDAAMHVPLIVRVPGGPRGVRSGELVTVTDIFATLLAAAGVPDAVGRDSFPLSAVAPDGPRRQSALGATSEGIVIDDGRYRLARYANGVATLYDFAGKGEAANLIDSPAAQGVRSRLDTLLATEALKATNAAHDDKRYAYRTMTPDHPAHRRGWQRLYPWRPDAG
jgi:arylsulfatase A-like enzyme